MTDTALPLANVLSPPARPAPGRKGSGDGEAGDFAGTVAGFADKDAAKQKAASGGDAASAKTAAEAGGKASQRPTSGDAQDASANATAQPARTKAEIAAAGIKRPAGGKASAQTFVPDEVATPTETVTKDATAAETLAERKAAEATQGKATARSAAATLSAQALQALQAKGLKASGNEDAGKTAKESEAAADEPLQTGSAQAGNAQPASAQGGAVTLLAMLAGAQAQAGKQQTGTGSDDEALPSKGLAKAGAPNAKVGKQDGTEDKAADAPAGLGDQTFRFARADGKGPAVTVKLSEDGSVSGKTDQPAPVKLEQVTVLETRRYLGVAMTSVNAPIVAEAVSKSARAGTSTLEAAALLQGTPEASGAGKVLDTLKIQMHPNDIGPVTATLKLKEDQLQVELRVNTGEAYRQLRGDQDAMVAALRSQGFSVDQVNIVYSPSASDGSTGQNGSDSPYSGQGNASQAGTGGGGQQASEGRGQAGEGSPQRQPSRDWNGKDISVEAAFRADPGQSGDLYI
ncbi:hypothetical protein BJF93_05970 [Xaviernesmea oryzae]|uniref:Flagellar hook-length control protein-like C-terminal domain-containing protein n=1 Tax=Xaviernesmea oryzae TaxID=464029 RepID=A0A1Q9AS11_9HYPH|nr:flagellar hook-length control protein FliK [Xaviernesmea oryzae]OLP58171.1 hypothetical protein BJF93_05970 [Xaviernesmea oryzae]SEL80205.1 chemotaxis protein MotD [Xaviernesmea oryzae]